MKTTAVRRARYKHKHQRRMNHRRDIRDIQDEIRREILNRTMTARRFAYLVAKINVKRLLLGEPRIDLTNTRPGSQYYKRKTTST